MSRRENNDDDNSKIMIQRNQGIETMLNLLTDIRAACVRRVFVSNETGILVSLYEILLHLACFSMA